MIIEGFGAAIYRARHPRRRGQPQGDGAVLPQCPWQPAELVGQRRYPLPSALQEAHASPAQKIAHYRVSPALVSRCRAAQFRVIALQHRLDAACDSTGIREPRSI